MFRTESGNKVELYSDLSYTVFELEDSRKSREIKTELTRNGIYSGVVSEGLIAVNETQKQRAKNLFEQKGYNARKKADDLTSAEIISWFSPESQGITIEDFLESPNR